MMKFFLPSKGFLHPVGFFDSNLPVAAIRTESGKHLSVS